MRVLTCRFLHALLAVAAGLGSQPLAAQTTQPADTLDVSDHVRAHEPYDDWTRHRLTGDWGGTRTELAEKGITFEFDLTQQWNAHGERINVRHACRISGADLGLAPPCTDRAFLMAWSRHDKILVFSGGRLSNNSRDSGQRSPLWNDGVWNEIGRWRVTRRSVCH